MARNPLSIWRAQWLVVSLRFTRDDLARLGTGHLVFGIAVTWAVGLGRYWDHPLPFAFQSLGVGSIAVLAVLGLLLFSILAPLEPDNWSLLHLYTFLSLTAFPALIYAIPVERHLPLGQAQSVNSWFLALVAGWRVVMLFIYLERWAGLRGWVLAVALLFPLTFVVAALTVLNLEQVVFLTMGGNRVRSPNDGAFAVLVSITIGSLFVFPVVLIGYCIAVYQRRWGRREARTEAA